MEGVKTDYPDILEAIMRIVRKIILESRINVTTIRKGITMDLAVLGEGQMTLRLRVVLLLDQMTISVVFRLPRTITRIPMNLESYNAHIVHRLLRNVMATLKRAILVPMRRKMTMKTCTMTVRVVCLIMLHLRRLPLQNPKKNAKACKASSRS